MKKLLFYIGWLACLTTQAQDFNKDMATAKAAYQTGKLEETHFALQQAMQEIDLIIGKEIIKLLPPKMDTLSFNAKDDQVATTIGYVGTSTHRSWGKGSRLVDLSIISNSPMVAMINTVLNNPMMGGMMNDGKSKSVKVQGYKGRLERKDAANEGAGDYELNIPMGSALITLKANGCTDTQTLAFAETIPLQQVAKLIQ